MTTRRKAERPFIVVLAGVNGAGKSSLVSAVLSEQGLAWFNPDDYARALIAEFGLSVAKANGLAWEHGRTQLEIAIASGSSFAFETTLGANTIPELLLTAARTHDVSILFCGLSSPEQHIARVRLRVAHGGHDIPEIKIRERWITSRTNLIKLLPYLSRLQVFDNSVDAEPGQAIPDPLLVLDLKNGRMAYPREDDAAALHATPEWARPIVQAALEISKDSNGR
ncbi:MAG: zeta toxin family protein [Burkholderiales bacterium]|nr:zeta toxin family protein [Burkholderiales bacterium]